MARAEWLVEGPNGNIWLAAKDGDDACDKYLVRFQLSVRELDDLTVTDVRQVKETRGGA